MNFDEAESYLFSLGNEVETMKLGLENITALLAALENPHDNYLKVQVAGTNGKGSVCAFLGSICLHAGIRTGVFTSPHLISVTERVRIGGEDISETDFAWHASWVRETAERLVNEEKLESVPTYFEQVTAIALLAFKEADVELAIIETGLGGRFDATTAANAEIAVITRIDLDHQEYLGDTIEKIAAEKAAIIRPGSNAIVVDQSAVVMSILNELCLDRGIIPAIASGVGLKELGFPPRKLALAGRHQFENARAATTAALTLRRHFEISDDAIAAGLENAGHAGRLEYIENFLLDGAHNPGGAAALAVYLDEYVSGPITMIFGAMQNKDVGRIAEILWPKAARLILTTPANSRAMTAQELSRSVPPTVDKACLIVTETVEEAVELATTHAGEGPIVVTGSLYLVGEVKRLLAEHPKFPSQI